MTGSWQKLSLRSNVIIQIIIDQYQSWTVSRAFEKLVYEQAYNCLVINNKLAPRQSGFRSLHSTVTALLDLNNQWCLN